MDGIDIRIHAARRPFSMGPQYIDLYGYDEIGKGVIQRVTLKKEKERFTAIDPFMQLGEEQAQQLMDSLWECGLRPTEGHGSAGAFGAVKAHLSDMRKIVEAKLRVKL